MFCVLCLCVLEIMLEMCCSSGVERRWRLLLVGFSLLLLLLLLLLLQSGLVFRLFISFTAILVPTARQ